ncbi:uncharacterized protein FIBRA_02394 [Fibroporia radiculosa]|uniref:tRNA-splicing endonuclease subunit Sen2 n=1 Tax=Fibroporia radiculosa TaxID=599839 RepID=J4H1U1_9APHY|nr:uncharacterized protein FIBRA_02394 [Fibroporia radiculosa]CCM00364.1 predicted protein [Fibroporia radiculosa]
MSLTAGNKRRGGGRKSGARRTENNRLYAHPLPLEFSLPQTSWSNHVLGLFGFPGTRVLNPHCTGIFAADTHSVWITEQRDVMILWRQGFFGKGDLSRSEPSWQARQISARKAAGKYMTAEEVREKRRAERKRFKLDRAAAMAQAAAEAEAAFAEGRQVEITTIIPSGATWKPQHAISEDLPDGAAAPSSENEEWHEEVPDLEHLQLTLQEAFFLLWNLNCLTIINSATSEPMTLQEIWAAFQGTPDSTPISVPLHVQLYKRFDNPFLVNYAVYHHYRSLGWIIKGGIKFCVDLLLYKRGPVFHHAEFAVIVLPVYEDPADQENSPFDLANAEPFSWSWLSTTLILAYVTIPAQSRISPNALTSPACLAHYSVRDIVLRRFIPARMRD